MINDEEFDSEEFKDDEEIHQKHQGTYNYDDDDYDYDDKIDDDFYEME